MDQEVDQVITPDIELPKLIIPGKRIESKKPAMTVGPNSRDIG